MKTEYRIKTTFENGNYETTVYGWPTREEAEAQAQRTVDMVNNVLQNLGMASPVKAVDIVRVEYRPDGVTAFMKN